MPVEEEKDSKPSQCQRETVLPEGDGARLGYSLRSFLYLASGWLGQARAESGPSVFVSGYVRRPTLPFPPSTLQGQKGLLVDYRMDVGRGQVGQESPLAMESTLHQAPAPGNIAKWQQLPFHWSPFTECA